MSKLTSPAFSLFFILLITLILTQFQFQFQFRFRFLRLANAGKVHIPDDLDDVIDDEEDDDWKNWGKKTTQSSQFDINPSDLDKMDPAQIQAQMMKHHTGPVFGFVKLRFGVHRTPETVSETAMKWSQVLKTGGLEVKFMGVDLSTIMLNSETAPDIDELKEFILEQPDAYEVKIGDNVYRRPGDPPLEEVLEMLKREKSTANSLNPDEPKQEL